MAEDQVKRPTIGSPEAMRLEPPIDPTDEDDERNQEVLMLRRRIQEHREEQYTHQNEQWEDQRYRGY